MRFCFVPTLGALALSLACGPSNVRPTQFQFNTGTTTIEYNVEYNDDGTPSKIEVEAGGTEVQELEFEFEGGNLTKYTFAPTNGDETEFLFTWGLMGLESISSEREETEEGSTSTSSSSVNFEWGFDGSLSRATTKSESSYSTGTGDARYGYESEDEGTREYTYEGGNLTLIKSETESKDTDIEGGESTTSTDDREYEVTIEWEGGQIASAENEYTSDGEKRTTEYETKYDDAGLLEELEVKDDQGNSTDYELTYDDSGRIEQIEYGESEVEIEYEDGSTSGVTFGLPIYDAMGLAFDLQGRPVSRPMPGKHVLPIAPQVTW